MFNTLHSPFNHIFRTNAVPSDAECEIIRDLVQVARKELAILTQDIPRLRSSFDDEYETMRDFLQAPRKELDLTQDIQSVFDEAACKSSELEQFIDAHLALVSLARRIPEDILRVIFMATLASGSNFTLSPHEPPLLLCQVCQF
ncbi:hypothetical protein MVEN_00505400 [Mycena venus]|uniref:Uncharacterized protein n=1 Tax=Mycena venus TaxID=2733690 RepID=A0A8H6YMX1_9AGAR|nr:hypothetical protein MVEN_00505400 [Mycena venus]